MNQLALLCFLLLWFPNSLLSQPTLQFDVALQTIISPAGNTIPDCLNNDSIPVSVIYENIGTDTLFMVPISYQYDNGIIITDTIQEVAPGLFHIYIFSNTIDISALGLHEITVWTSYPGDMNLLNDTIQNIINVVPGNLHTIPHLENFESAQLCDTISDCGNTLCMITGMWSNAVNGIEDDIDFRVNSGSTPTDSTGPDADHTYGNSTGKYIYLESSDCVNKTSILNSACIDLKNAINPELRFWYHFYGTGMGTLMLHAYCEGRWYYNMIPPISGDYGNAWYEMGVSLAQFKGNNIILQFYAVTGSDSSGRSDIAIDDILVAEPGSPPLPLFSGDTLTGCSGRIVHFTDLSAYLPTTWQYIITPSTCNYINGTDSLTPNPVVQFNAPGLYSMTLNCTNVFGSGTFIRTDYITIYQPAGLPVIEDFESGIFPPPGWKSSLSNEYDWDTLIVIGSNGLSTVASYVNDYNNYATATEDELRIYALDLSITQSPLLTFDLAYARYDSLHHDALRIDISTDCGSNFIPTGYLKSGLQLATAPDTQQEFFPLASTHWRRDTLSLTSWLSQEVIIRFVNMNDFGNNLFIDNILIQDVVGLSNPELQNEIKIFPNPATEYITMQFYENSNDLSMEIFDLQSRLVYSENLGTDPDNSIRIDIRLFPSGIYFLKTYDGKNIRSGRFIVTH